VENEGAERQNNRIHHIVAAATTAYEKRYDVEPSVSKRVNGREDFIQHENRLVPSPTVISICSGGQEGM